MSADGDYIRREQPPASESLIPALEETLELSEKQKKFLLQTIQGFNPDAVDIDAELVKQVSEVQDRAYKTYPYKCIRGYNYVSFPMSENDAFAYVLKQGQSASQNNAPLILDIGCCMGTDLRYLVYSGYPSTSVIGCDLRQVFIDLGHELYADRDVCPIPFFAADVFDITLRPFPQKAESDNVPLKEIKSLNELRGRVKYIHAGSLFHLFDEGTQEAIARRLTTLLDVTEGGGPAIIFGRHNGKVEEGIMDDIMGRIKFAHSPESWEQLWRRIVGDTRPLRVDAVLRPRASKDTSGVAFTPGTQPMWWSVWIE